ncbi:MAG: hypothetical protein VYA30_13155 [Myxococcota bacterium]|nr:hypothetical protein [Myxococcota bacterium]
MFARIKKMLSKRAHADATAHEPHAPPPIQDENLLYLSDLHLGEACKNVSRIDYLKLGTSLDHHITSFLAYYTLHRLEERPWRLVLGGDLLDFLQVTMTPEGADQEQNQYGLSNSEVHSVWKLEKLMERHRAVFVHLADFVASGNRLEILQGNHDVELFWPGVRTRFVEVLESIYFGDEAGIQVQRENFRASINFHPWFLYLPNFAYMEHGHRFDEFCNTSPQLCPLRPKREELIVQPLSAIAIQYFANLEAGFATHDKEHWGLADYIRYFRGGGVRRACQLIGRDCGLAYHSLKYHRISGRYESAKANTVHQEQLQAMADAYGLQVTRLEALDALTATSIMSSFVHVAANVCLGEVLALFVTGVTALSCLLLGAEPAVTLLTATLTATASFGTALLLRRTYDRNIRAKLKRAAQRINSLMDVPIVIFGHSHAPRLERLESSHRHFYANSGSFLRPHGPVHDSESPCNCRHTFIIVEKPQKYQFPRPRLMTWCQVNQESIELPLTGT